MKTYETVMVSWRFDQLFPGNQFVFGNFWNHSLRTAKTKVCIGEVLIYNSLPIPNEPRQLRLVVRESQFGKRVMKKHHLPCTLQEAENLGAIPRNGCFGHWVLKKGDGTIRGAIRIAQEFFKLINLHTEPFFHTTEDLFSHFAISQHTLVFADGEWHAIENFMRHKYGLRGSPINARMIGRLPSYNTLDDDGILCSNCNRLGRGSCRIDGHLVRLVSCGSCHKTWFCHDGEKALWYPVDSETYEILSLQFKRLDI